MGHKFNPGSLHKLDNPERREKLPPESVLQAFGLKAGDIVADIGCGSGYFSLPAARLVGDSGLVLAMDILPEMLEIVREKALLQHVDYLRCLQVREQGFDLDKETASFAMAFFVLHEADSQQQFLGEIQRILKPQGRLALIDWEKRPTKQGPPVEHRISKAEAIEFLQAAGFSVEEVAIGEDFYGLLAKKC